MFKTKRFLIALAMSAVAFSASATPIVSTDNVDKLLGSANLSNSGDGTELTTLKSLVNSQLGLTYTGGLDKGVSNFTAVETSTGSGTWVIDLADGMTPGYFSLKFATGKTGKNDTYFFQNLDDLNHLVFTNAQVNFLSGDCGVKGACNIGKLSHYSLGDNVQTPVIVPPAGGEVPEPASLALFGVGMLGLGALRKRRA